MIWFKMKKRRKDVNNQCFNLKPCKSPILGLPIIECWVSAFPSVTNTNYCNNFSFKLKDKEKLIYDDIYFYCFHSKIKGKKNEPEQYVLLLLSQSGSKWKVKTVYKNKKVNIFVSTKLLHGFENLSPAPRHLMWSSGRGFGHTEERA